MNPSKYIQIEMLCTHYQIDRSFFTELNELGLIKLTHIENKTFIHPDYLANAEKWIRIRQDLDLNMEGIDVVNNLLQRIDLMQNEVIRLQNRLRLYEDD